jgi:hypothetical protein
MQPRQDSIVIVPVSAEEQNRRVNAAIARRAYQIFEKRGGMGWHELEDWTSAESEIRRPDCVGLTSRDHVIVIDVDLAHLEPGTVEIWVAPFQVTISGNHVCSKRRTTHDPTPPCLTTYRTVALHCAIDPDRVKLRVHDTSLEICLSPAQQRQPAHSASAA